LCGVDTVQALVTLACQAPDRETAAATAKSIILRQAQFNAQIAVWDVEIIDVKKMDLS
jgi:hypothetical protein